MKKIFMLLMAAGSITIASAQSRNFDHSKQDVSYSFNSKQAAIRDINREYDFKISAIRYNRRMNGWEKSRQVSQLERQRDAAIEKVEFRFRKDNHGFNDHGYANNKKNRW